ncbi:MAG: hypothetical protein P9M03_03775 [Candidatus Theseobacter exili]|nr:hypothetical protein [Candidatus Theseobacter exili]
MKTVFPFICVLLMTITNSNIFAARISVESCDKEVLAGTAARVTVAWSDISSDGYKIVVQLENWDTKPAVLFLVDLNEFESTGNKTFKITIPEDTRSVKGCRYVAAVLSETKNWEDIQCVSDSPKNVRIVNGKQTELQWKDFGDKTIEFSGYTWRIKEGGKYGPGNNFFSASKDNIWIDDKGWLHLKITKRKEKWYCPEIVLDKPLGYGDYIFKTVGRVDQLDPNIIFGLFLWEYAVDYSNAEKINVANEFDIEFGTWKDPKCPPAQFVCHPWQKKGNENKFWFQLKSDDSKTSHAFLWHPSGMACRSWSGHSDRPQPKEMIHSWFYGGDDLPRNEYPRIHINFWCIEEPPSDGNEHEVILAEFKFIKSKRLKK